MRIAALNRQIVVLQLATMMSDGASEGKSAEQIEADEEKIAGIEEEDATEASEAAEAAESAAETPKPDIRQTAAEKNTVEGSEANLESLEHVQKVNRNAVKSDAIQDISKANQRARAFVI